MYRRDKHIAKWLFVVIIRKWIETNSISCSNETVGIPVPVLCFLLAPSVTSAISNTWDKDSFEFSFFLKFQVFTSPLV